MINRVFFILFFLLFCYSSNLLGQNIDKLYLTNKKVIEGKIIQITSSQIEINPIGEKPFLIIPRDSAEVLIYSDNTIVNFKIPKNTKNTPSNTIRHFKFSDELIFPKSNPLRLKWSKFYVYTTENHIINDTVNNKELRLNCNGYYNIKKSFKTYSIGYIKLDFDLVYDGEVYRDAIIIDEKVQFKKSKGKRDYFPRQFILDMGLYKINIKLSSSSGYTDKMHSVIIKTPKYFNVGYGFYIDLLLETIK